MTKTVKQSAIANITKAIVKPTKPVKANKPSKGVVMLSDSETLETVAMYHDGYTQGLSSVALMNKAIKPYHDRKVKLCKSSETKSELYEYSTKVRTMFLDTFKGTINPKTNKPLSKDYIEKMLYPKFLSAVNSGNEITQINTSQAKAQANAKANKANAKANKANAKANKVKTKESEIVSFNNALAKIVSSATSQAKAIKYIEGKLDTMSLIDAIKDYLDTQDVKTK